MGEIDDTLVAQQVRSMSDAGLSQTRAGLKDGARRSATSEAGRLSASVVEIYHTDKRFLVGAVQIDVAGTGADRPHAVMRVTSERI